MLTRNNWARFPLFGLLVLLLLQAGAVRAQEPAAGRIESVNDGSYPTVRAIVTLVDEAGRPLAGLTADSFRAQETGAPAAVSGVDTVLDQQLGVAVILLVDTSGSMQGAPIAEARNAARSFVQNLPPTDQAAVVSFAEDVVIESALTAQRQGTLDAIDRLAAAGNTALFSGVVEAIAQARDAELARKAVILLSDGQDFGGASQATRQQSLDLAASTGVPVYAIGLGQDVDRPYLEELAAASGGRFIEAPAAGSIPQIYDQLSQLLRSQYVVTLESSAPADIAERNLRLVVTTPAGEIELAAEYTTRRAIAAQPAPPSPTVASPAVVGPLDIPESDGSGSSLLIPLAVLLAGAGLGGTYLYYRRRKALRELDRRIGVMSQRAAADLGRQGAAPVRGVGAETTHRIWINGPGIDQPFEVGDEPLVAGSNAESPIHLPSAEGVAAQHARFWVREGKLVLHHLAPGYESTVGGRSITWVTLDPGDEVQIGPYLARVDG